MTELTVEALVNPSAPSDRPRARRLDDFIASLPAADQQAIHQEAERLKKTERLRREMVGTIGRRLIAENQEALGILGEHEDSPNG
jgi:hypothetical protein